MHCLAVYLACFQALPGPWLIRCWPCPPAPPSLHLSSHKLRHHLLNSALNRACFVFFMFMTHSRLVSHSLNAVKSLSRLIVKPCRLPRDRSFQKRNVVYLMCSLSDAKSWIIAIVFSGTSSWVLNIIIAMSGTSSWVLNIIISMSGTSSRVLASPSLCPVQAAGIVHHHR